MTGPRRDLHAVELRDEAVRILRRAVEAVQAAEFRRALAVLDTEGTHWWNQCADVPGVEAFDQKAAA